MTAGRRFAKISLASTPDQITLCYVLLQVPRVGRTNKKARSNVRALKIGWMKKRQLD